MGIWIGVPQKQWVTIFHASEELRSQMITTPTDSEWIQKIALAKK